MNYLQQNNKPPAQVFAIAGLDGRAISSKSLLIFSSRLTLTIKLQIVSSAKIF